MGFGSPFISLITACISGPWISPFDGRPGEAFQSSWGLKQGCPLSPYVFILMAESFSQALDFNRRVGLIIGIKFGNGAKNINHSQFADDTFLIGGDSTTIARRFKVLLDQFMGYSGGLINQQKNCIYGWNASNKVIHKIANIFGVPCNLDWTHFSYLGMPVSLGPLKAGTWDSVIDKMKRKVPQWGSMWLNPAGRLILLKSGISSLPLYHFSLFQAPASFLHKMEVVLHHFLWQGGKNDKKKFNLVSWKQVIQAQDRGGLGIRSPTFLNLAFGGKIVWRLITDPSTWWKMVLETKYLTSPRQQILDSDIPNRDSSKICKVPIKKNERDEFRWDPSGSAYTVQAGHQHICYSTFPMTLWNQWRMVWNSEALPKIKFFIWALLKGKILITENLQKRGIIGPSRCPNCYGIEETTHHIFVDCPFAVDCWKKLSLIDKLPWNSQQSIGEVIHLWKKSYPGDNKRRNLVKRVWNTLPYTMLWSIWLARNWKTFKDKSSTTRIVCNKAKNLALKTILVKTQSNIDVAMYSVEERSFISYIWTKETTLRKAIQ
eukprot:PITA_03821